MDAPKAKLGRPPRNKRSDEGQDEILIARPSIYMSRQLEMAIEEIAVRDESSKSRIISDVMELLILSPIGQKLCERAKLNRQTLAQMLEETLTESEEPLSEEVAMLVHGSHKQNAVQMLTYLMQELPSAEIIQYAKNSRRPPLDMLIYLSEIGLRFYKQKVAQLDQMMEENRLE